MRAKLLTDRYRLAVKLGIKLVDMDASALAGYYLAEYPGDPIGALLTDINNLRVPDTVGQSAKIIILSLLTNRFGNK